MVYRFYIRKVSYHLILLDTMCITASPEQPEPEPITIYVTICLEYCLLFIVLFAKNYTNQIKSNYLNSHGEEAQEKPPGL